MDLHRKSATNLGYPLVNIQKTMENHHLQWVNPLFLWPFSIAMLNYQRVDPHIQVSNQYDKGAIMTGAYTTGVSGSPSG